MSHYDAPSIGNAVSQGISFITHKIGGDSTDQEADEWWAGVRGLPSSVVLGGYWVLYPGNPIGRADAFLARLDLVCPGWRDRDAFILQVDAEIWGGDASTKPSIAECNTFADRLVSKTGGKYVPIGYLPKWVYGDASSFRYPLWASSYVSGSGAFKSLYPGDTSSRWNGYGRSPVILQYTSSATIGSQTTCDANAFRGTVLDLKRLVTPGGTMALLDSDDYTNIAAAVVGRLNSELRSNTQYAAISKAIPWQYTGNGLQGAVSSLAALADSQTVKAQIAALTTAVAGVSDVDEDALAALISATLLTPLRDAVLAGLPGDLDETVREAIEESVNSAASRIRLTIEPQA